MNDHDQRSTREILASNAATIAELKASDWRKRARRRTGRHLLVVGGAGWVGESNVAPVAEDGPTAVVVQFRRG